MRRAHFEKLTPICPRCKKQGNGDHRLSLHTILKERTNRIIEGILICTNSECSCEYPIIDGIPVIVADIRDYIQNSAFPVIKRNDFSEGLESLLGDCMGPGSLYDTIRQYLSTYGSGHYGDLEPDSPGNTGMKTGSVLNILSENLPALSCRMDGPIIDMGCSVGRTSFELSKRFNTRVLGVDLNFPMLQAAARVLETGRFVYPKRTVGIVYERTTIETGFKEDRNVDFWACDVLNLPFPDEVFSFGLGLNTLDCVGEPYRHLQEMERVFRPGALALLSTPYDWNPTAVPVENWLGGHSQRSETNGRSEEMLHSLFAGGSHPGSIENLELIYEKQHVPWAIRIHSRSVMTYRVHVMGLRKIKP